MSIDEEAAPRVDEALAALELTDGEGRRERLGALWRERPTVLLFVRHFG